jgi:RND family efflux transporter MFP subunit
MKDNLTRTTGPATNGVEHSNASTDGLGNTDDVAEQTTWSTQSTLTTPRRRPWRIIVPLAVLGLLAVVAAIWLLTPPKALPTATVTRGTIISTVETTGKLEAETAASLAFKTSGVVEKVLAKQGDNVEAGEVLAQLDTAQLSFNLAEANTQLEISKLKLQQAKDGARPEDITAAAADLDAAIARLNNTRSGGRVEDIAAATAALNQAQAKLDAVKKGASKQDIEQAQAMLTQAQAHLQAVKQPATPDQIAQAEAAVREAQANYNSLKAGARAEDLKAAQAALDQATANLNKVKAGPTTDDIAGAQAKLDQAKATRDQTAAAASNAKEQARLDMVQASNALQNAQDAYGKIKYDNDHVSPGDLTDDDRNKEAKALRDVQDAQARVDQALSTYNTAKANEIAQLNSADASVREAQAAVDKVKAAPTAQDIAIAQADVDSAKAKLDALKAGPKSEDLAAAQAGVDQAQANLNGLKAGGTPSDVAAAQAEVDKAQAALDKLKAGPTPEEIREAEQAVAQAKANLDKVKAGATPDEIREAQAQVDAAQANLDKAKAGPQPTDLEILQRQIDLAQISVDRATSAVADAQLKAPFGGTLLTIDVKMGEMVGAQQPIASLADTSSLRITADIDEIDIGRVSAGQAVTVTLDPYPGVKMAGKIERLAPGATQKQGSTVYQATISFRPAEGVVPREGMAANVDITAQRKDNVLLLPNRAFETVGNRQYVTLSENGSSRKVEVETGLSNNTDTEVVSGLEPGQVVLLR